jgi:uncharacterized membrane protein YesL
MKVLPYMLKGFAFIGISFMKCERLRSIQIVCRRLNWQGFGRMEIYMGNLFNLDNGFFTFLSKICDIIFISFIWLITCIPIVTIGPASTALYYATVKVIRRDRGYLFREYVRSLKLNFKRALIIGLILTVLFAVMAIDLRWARITSDKTGNFGAILHGVFIATTIVLSCISIYIFPLLSRFDMTVKQLFKASAFMALRHFPSTIAMAVIMAIGALAVYILWITIFIVPTIVVFLNSFFMERILKKYMPKSDEATDEEHPAKDEWYME